MNRFAELLDRLAYEPGRNNKLRLITAYFREAGDPDRGYALAARPLDLVGYGDEEESETLSEGEEA